MLKFTKISGRRVGTSGFMVTASLLLWAGNVFPQSIEKEVAVVELGGAVERSLTEGNSSFGPTAAVEVTPIEKWLELEVGVTPLFRRHSTEWSVDLLFKKTWSFSDRFERIPSEVNSSAASPIAAPVWSCTTPQMFLGSAGRGGVADRSSHKRAIAAVELIASGILT